VNSHALSVTYLTSLLRSLLLGKGATNVRTQQPYKNYCLESELVIRSLHLGDRNIVPISRLNFPEMAPFCFVWFAPLSENKRAVWQKEGGGAGLAPNINGLCLCERSQAFDTLASLLVARSAPNFKRDSFSLWENCVFHPNGKVTTSVKTKSECERPCFRWMFALPVYLPNLKMTNWRSTTKISAFSRVAFEPFWKTLHKCLISIRTFKKSREPWTEDEYPDFSLNFISLHTLKVFFKYFYILWLVECSLYTISQFMNFIVYRNSKPSLERRT